MDLVTQYAPEEFEVLADELRTTARGLLPDIVERKLSLMITACDLAAEMARPEPSPWRPIETAPMNGMAIIAKSDTTLPEMVAVVSWRAHRLGDDVLADYQMRWRDIASGRHFSPTHWMPIPNG